MEMRQVFGETLVQLAASDDRIVVLDADLNTSTKTDLFKAAFPDRFIELGIAEQNMFGWAAGLASAGLIPFPTTFASFASTRGLDQIRVSIAYQNHNVKIAGSYPGISADKGGATHASMEDLAIMRSIPNMRVLAPADATELRQVMQAIVDYTGPVYFRVTKYEVPDVFDSSYTFDWRPVLLRNGHDITIVSTGYMTHKCVEAVDLLSHEGIEASAVHVPCLKPLDIELLVRTAAESRAIITVEDHNVLGGLGSAVTELLSERAPRLVHRIGIHDHFCKSGDKEELCRAYGLTSISIAEEAIKILKGVPA